MDQENTYRRVRPVPQPSQHRNRGAGYSYTGGMPLKNRGHAVHAIAYEGNEAAWNANMDVLPQGTRGDHHPHAAAMQDEQQARFHNLASANDFRLFNAAIPPAASEPHPFNSSKITVNRDAGDDDDGNKDPRAGFDPLVPNYVHPMNEPMQPPPETQDNEAPLQHMAHRGEASRAYPMVYRDAPFLQIPQGNLILNPVPYYLSIDSRDRDRTTWPSTSYFRIPLVVADNKPSVLATGRRYKNIHSIALLSAVVPRVDSALDEPYLLLQIDEIDDVYDAANPTGARAFSKLFFREGMAGSNFLRLDDAIGDPSTKFYWPAPKASLDSITISFLHYDGTPVDFGADTVPPAVPLTSVQTSITLAVRTFVVDVPSAIGHRNI